MAIADFTKFLDLAMSDTDLDREKNSGIGYYLRGMALAMGGDADKAMDDYEKAAQAKFTPDELHLLHEQIMKALRRA